MIPLPDPAGAFALSSGSTRLIIGSRYDDLRHDLSANQGPSPVNSGVSVLHLATGSGKTQTVLHWLTRVVDGANRASSIVRRRPQLVLRALSGLAEQLRKAATTLDEFDVSRFLATVVASFWAAIIGSLHPPALRPLPQRLFPATPRLTRGPSSGALLGPREAILT